MLCNHYKEILSKWYADFNKIYLEEIILKKIFDICFFLSVDMYFKAIKSVTKLRIENIFLISSKLDYMKKKFFFILCFWMRNIYFFYTIYWKFWFFFNFLTKYQYL